MIIEKQKDLYYLKLLIPWLIVFCIFWLYPLVYSFILSFTKYYSLTNELKFIGFNNYLKLVNDETFLKAISNTIVFTLISVPITTTLALLLAIAINRKLTRFQSFFKVTFFLPSVTSLVVMSLIFTILYSQNGYINTLCGMIGIPFPTKGWLLDPDTSLISIIAMDIWISVGYYMFFFFAALQTIPNELYEAADIYGANRWTKFKVVTLSMLKPTLLFVLIINTIKSLQIFIEIYVMTKGGPLDSTTTMVFQIYKYAFENIDMMGYASAAAYLLFIITTLLSIIQFKLIKQN